MRKPDEPEVWQRIMGMAGMYTGFQISTWGNVKDPDGQLIRPWFAPGGEFVLTISADGGAWETTMPVWMIMLRNFYDGRLDDIFFDYADGDVTNCALSNMIPVSRDEVGFRYPIGWHEDSRGFRVLDRRPTRRGKRVRVVETGDVFESVQEAAQELHTYPANIYAVLSGRQKRHRGFTFEYVEQLLM